MRSKTQLMLFVKISMLLLCIPFLMGQQGCPNEFVTMLDGLLGPGGKFEPTEALYVNSLSFMDAVTKTIMLRTETADLINKAVLQGIHNAQKVNDKIKHNERGHAIEDNDANGQAIIDVTFHPNMTGDEKITKIIQDMMDPKQVDVIISGQYIDSGQSINVRPYTIDKRNKNIVSREATFAKDDFVCSDPAQPAVKVLCQDAHEEIARMVEDLLKNL